MYDSAAAVRFIRTHSSFLVLGHKEPDGDCVASQLGMAALLRALGKEAALYSVGPFDRPEIEAWSAQFSASIPPADRSGRAVVIVDCSTPDRTGRVGAEVEGLPTLVVDHHSAGEVFGDARMVDASAPSATILVLDLFEALGVTPDKETATLLLFGLCTDTGFFRHLGSGTGETFRTIARLVDCGTSTAEIFIMVYGTRDMRSRKLLATMLRALEREAPPDVADNGGQGRGGRIPPGGG